MMKLGKGASNKRGPRKIHDDLGMGMPWQRFPIMVEQGTAEWSSDERGRDKPPGGAKLAKMPPSSASDGLQLCVPATEWSNGLAQP